MCHPPDVIAALCKNHLGFTGLEMLRTLGGIFWIPLTIHGHIKEWRSRMRDEKKINGAAENKRGRWRENQLFRVASWFPDTEETTSHLGESLLPSHQQVVSLYDTVAMGTVHQLVPLLHLLQDSIIKGVLGIPGHKHGSAKC